MMLIDIEPYKDCYIGKDIAVNFSDGPLVGMSGEVFAKVTAIKDVPVVKAHREAHWIEHSWIGGELSEIPKYECSNCRSFQRKCSDYCPDCGFFMSEKCEFVCHNQTIKEYFES